MYESEQAWRDVDRYFLDSLAPEDEGLRAAVESARAGGLPMHEVAPNQGKFLTLMAEMIGARRVLEFGTLAGYSTIWLARAVGPGGLVTTFELDPGFARIARENLERAGLIDRVDVLTGPALESAERLIGEEPEPYDLIFIDADKPNNPAYLAASLQLIRPGGVVIGDNVVRDGAVVDAASTDDRVQGVRTFIEELARHPGITATALQTVGLKGWDGLTLAIVRDPLAQVA